MKIGNIVRIARPYTSDIPYENAIGVVVHMVKSITSPEDMICYVRCISVETPCTHKTKEIFQHRLDLIKD